MLNLIAKLVKGSVVRQDIDPDEWLRIEFVSNDQERYFERLFFTWEGGDYLIQIIPIGVEDATINRVYTGANIKIYTMVGTLILNERIKGSIHSAKRAALIKLRELLMKNLTTLEGLINAN